MREMKLLIFLKKKLFHIKVKKKKKEKEESEENNFYESKSINYDLFEKLVNLLAPTVLVKKLYETKDKKKTMS